MIAESLQNYSVGELNSAIANLLERGFPPRFLLHASVSKSQLKKGHLWLSLTDGKSVITGVIWASILKKLTYIPSQDDGVLIVGKLNFWTTRATLNVQVLDIRPSISTVLRKFEIVRERLDNQGLLDASRKRRLPLRPSCIAILTSVPSSAAADILRTAKELWPITKLLIIPIPVQGEVAKSIYNIINNLALRCSSLGIEAIVLARGGGSREDLILFDDEQFCRALAEFPVPVITGIGHEDDLTVADLVSDHRAATPTAAIVALLPSRAAANLDLEQKKKRLLDFCSWNIRKEKQKLKEFHIALAAQSPLIIIQRYRTYLANKKQFLKALSPERWLARGFAIVTNNLGQSIKSIKEVSNKECLTIQLKDGQIDSIVNKVTSSN